MPREKSLRARKKTNNKLNPHMMPAPGIAPGTHWWEVSALTTAPSLLLLPSGARHFTLTVTLFAQKKIPYYMKFA